MVSATAAAFSSGVTAGVATAGTVFRRFYDDPRQVQGGAVPERIGYYDLLWRYYNNAAFEGLDTGLMTGMVAGQMVPSRTWQSYRARYQLYRNTRSIYSPVQRLCDFYANTVYPGVLSEDGTELPDGVPLAIPLSKDTPPEMKACVSQFWQWSNWQNNMGVYVLYGAISGNVLVEVEDDLEREKVTARIWWPALVPHVVLDSTGNLVEYAIEYDARDEFGNHYRYKKLVDRYLYSTYKDGNLHDYSDDGQGAEWANPYGFVPAVWAKHRDIGTDYGAPAIGSALGKIDELNSIVSHAHDHVHKLVENSRVMWDDGGVGTDKKGEQKAPPTNEYDTTRATLKEAVKIYHGPIGGRMDSVVGNVPLADVLKWIDKLTGEIEQDFPELHMYTEMRAMSQLTGPAAARIMGDVAGRYNSTCASYDMSSVKLFQMQAAIGGFRANGGGWGRDGPLTRQQAKYLPFDLSSYASGQLDMAIAPRPLVPSTQREALELDLLRASVVAAQATPTPATVAENLRSTTNT